MVAILFRGDGLMPGKGYPRIIATQLNMVPGLANKSKVAKRACQLRLENILTSLNKCIQPILNDDAIIGINQQHQHLNVYVMIWSMMSIMY